MPNYTRHLKDLMKNKSRLEEASKPPWEQDDFMEEANLSNVSLNCEIEDFFKLNDLDVPLVSPFIDFTDSDDDDGDVNNERQEMMERKGDYETIIDETYS
ncbi:hypothetical protein Tco_1321955 [Tanacetum coccineum]